MIDRLPTDILRDLYIEAPSLGAVNRRLYEISEYLSERRVLKYFEGNETLVEALAADVREHLQLNSWRVVEVIMKRDYWIFGPEHMNRLSDCSISTCSPKKPMGGSTYIDGGPIGLYVHNWGGRCLEYTTRLRAGNYQMFLDVSVSELSELSRMRFHVIKGPRVKPNFASIPPVQWLKRQSQATDIVGDMEIPITKVCVGCVEVTAGADSEWTDVSIRIESLDWDEKSLGVILNFLYFELHNDQSRDCPIDWVIQKSDLTSPDPSYALATIYKLDNERKQQWMWGAKMPAQSV